MTLRKKKKFRGGEKTRMDCAETGHTSHESRITRRVYMDKESKKKRIGQTVAFYAALAVCLIAVGVGTWELFQPNAA